jgi:hypothetical protein
MPYGNLNVDTVTTSTQGGVLGAGNASIMKNRIINGSMVIDQRNAGASVTITSNVYTLDRWISYQTTTSAFSVQQNAGSVTPPVGFVNYLGVTSLAATSLSVGSYFMQTQIIEGYNIADLGWGTANAKTVTLSFWVRSSLTGTFGGALNNNAGDRSYPFTYTISSANTWEQKSVTITGCPDGTWESTNSAGIKLRVGLGVGSTYSGTAGSWASANYFSATGATSVVGTSGATFYITGVQLEVGSSATGFEYRIYSTEFANCQRYYSVIQDWYVRTYQTGGVYFGSGMTFAVQMRTTPTMTAVGSTGYTNASGMVVICDQGNSAFKLYALTTTTGDSRFSCSGSSNYITASAEL